MQEINKGYKFNQKNVKCHFTIYVYIIYTWHNNFMVSKTNIIDSLNNNHSHTQ